MNFFRSTLVLLAWCISLPAFAQNVGIGTDNPLYKLHIKTTGAGNNTITFLESDVSSSIWLSTPPGHSKALTFLENGSTVANIGWNNGVMRIYTDYSGLLPKPTITMSEGYKLGINMGLISDPEQTLTVNGKIKLWLDNNPPTEGTMRYDTSTNTFQGFNGSAWGDFGGHWTRDINNLHFSDGSVFVGRTSNIGFERFGIRYPVTGPQLGGMHVETYGHPSGKPFYGYAVDGVSRMHHYFDGLSNTWRVNLNGDKLFLNSSGRFGIGISVPEAYLHVAGGNWNPADTEGDFKIGSTTHRLVVGMATGGVDAGDARIYAKGGTNRIIFGANESDVMAIRDGGLVGIGTNDPGYSLDIASGSERGINVYNGYSGTSAKFGGRFEVSGDGTGYKYGVYGSAYGDGTSANWIYGGRFFANGSGNPGNVYGLYTNVSASGTGNHYGLYTYAPTTDPNPGVTRSWALYASGNSYFSNEVRIGTINGATGYRLSVAGKIISEEVKVQMTENWPDYVFDEGYDLKNLDEIDHYIKENGHLPGIPSAREVADQNGVELGEMNRVLLEKIEELTLHMIRLNKEIEELRKASQNQ